jgi:glycosyltransferase involved in cell wall biosynthesis
MRINWYSPLPPAKSGIADFTASVLPALADRFDVTLWTDQQPDGLEASGFGNVRHIDQKALGARSTQDTVDIFNMGNNFTFHGPIFEVAKERPGIMLMHDVGLLDFFHHYYAALMPESSFLRLSEVYGLEATELLVSRRANRSRISDLTSQLPFLQTVLRNALGAVAFSSDAFTALSTSGAAPAYHLNLPFKALPQRSSRTPIRGRIVIFGHLGDNRRIPELLASIASYPRRAELHLDIYGVYYQPVALRSLLAELNLTESVNYHGFVADDMLDQAIDAASLVVNLRFPSMGEASISQLKAWSRGVASIVTPIGWYAELPSDTLLFAPLEREESALHAAFSLTLDEPETLAAMGSAGQSYFMRHHTVERFVDGLEQVLHDWPSLCARWAMERWLGRVATITAPWGGDLPDEHCNSVAVALSRLAPLAFDESSPKCR